MFWLFSDRQGKCPFVWCHIASSDLLQKNGLNLFPYDPANEAHHARLIVIYLPEQGRYAGRHLC